MALIYDSSHSGQEIDAAVDAVQTTIPSQLTQIGSNLDEIKNKVDARNISSIGELENLTSGYYLDVNTGVARQNGVAMYVTNDYYPLVKGDVLTYGLSGAAPWGLVCFYDENKTFKTSVAGQGWNVLVEGMHTTTADLEYVRFCYLYERAYYYKEYVTITHNSIPRLVEVETDLNDALFLNKYFAANSPSMLGEEYFHSGGLQGDSKGAPATSRKAVYSTPIPYTPCSITISATDDAKALITGIRIQVRNDDDFSTTDFRLIHTGYSWPSAAIVLPKGYKYISFGFGSNSNIDYSSLDGITITSDTDWVVKMPKLAEHIADLEDSMASVIEWQEGVDVAQNMYPFKKLPQTNGMLDSQSTFVTYPIPARAGDVVTWNPMILNSVLSVNMNEYDADGNFLGAWNNHTSERQCTLANSETAYIMATFFYEYKDSAQILVNGELVWSNPRAKSGLGAKLEEYKNEIDESVKEMQLVKRYFDANTPSMLDESYFSIGSIQGSGNGEPAYYADCCYSKLIPYVGGSTITISATEAAKALIKGIRIQVRNDNDFSTTNWSLRLGYTGYGWPAAPIILPSTYKYVTFGFATVGAAAWSYEMLDGITITTDKEWSISIKELAKHIVALEDADALQDERIEALEEGAANNIITRNNPAQTTNILQQWSVKPKVGRTSTYAPTSPLVLLHFSDIHGDADEVGRIVQFKNKYSAYINDVIHTGDSHYNTWADGFTLWEIDGASGFLNTIGNHDTASLESETYDWTHYVGLEAYNRFFAPYIANWGVVQPTDAAVNGYCYYYKDYSSCGIRLVVIDDMGWDNTQLEWFQSVVNDTLTNGFGLIVAKHYPMTSNNYIALEWASVIDQKAGSIGGSSNNNALIGVIDTFIANGGNFICWLNGHTHRDIFTMVGADNKQLCVTISTATTRQPWWDECLKVAGTKSEDLFNLISFDSYLKIVKVLRIGNDYNYYGQHRGTITIDYTNGNVISQV